ncbi:MAG TPA: metallophosphoesterase, partial [Nitrososphaeraceae archaeon]
MLSIDDEFFSIVPEDYYDPRDYGEESIVTNQLQENNTSDENTLPITNTYPFNIAITADWGCEKDTKKTAENIQNKNPELVIGAGDLSYDESADCWFEIIQPFKSKMKIAMGDHEYIDTSGGATGIINQYLKPLNLEKT